MSEAPHDLVRRFAVALESVRPAGDDAGHDLVRMPPEVRCWLQDGLSAWLESGGRRPLDVFLGLRGRGVRSLETRAAERNRDEALGAALACTGSASELAEAIRRFRRKWERVQDRTEPPQDLSDLERHLWRAFRAGRPVPMDEGHLRARARMK